MFFENNYARPLFDNTEGGPPKAFQCLECNRVCRTERGIRMHLKYVHDWEEQPCLYSTEAQNEVKNQGEPRKLRVFSKQNLQKTRSISLSQPMDSEPEATIEVPQPNKSEMKEQGLLKLTNEEN